MSDPTVPLPYPNLSDSDAALDTLMDKQLKIAGVLQDMVIRDHSSLSSRELRDLSASASNLLALSHRTNQLTEALKTYKEFVSVVLEFLKTRSDHLWEDLLAELREVGKQMSVDMPTDLSGTGAEA